MPTWRTGLLSVMLFVSFLVISSPPLASCREALLSPLAGRSLLSDWMFVRLRSPTMGGGAAASLAGVCPQAPGQRLGDVLAVERLGEKPRLLGVGGARHLGEDGGHLGGEQHDERGRLDPAVLDPRVHPAQRAEERALHDLGELS